jgi:hypothetical protein
VTGNDAGSGGNMIAADDNYSVSSRMADSAADATRAIHDVGPFDSGTNTYAGGAPGGALDAEAQVEVHTGDTSNMVAPTSEFIGGDIQHDPGMDATHNFVPSDSADVQREMLDGTTDGGALGNTGSGHPS